MDDTRKVSIRYKVFKALDLAKDRFQSADVLYKSEKYQASIAFFREAILYGIRALSMLHHDDVPDDSRLVDFFYQTDISKEMKLNFELKEILARLDSAQEESVEYPLEVSKRIVRNLTVCRKHAGSFLTKARQHIEASLLTAQEIKKKKLVREITIAAAFSILAIFVLVRIIVFISNIGHGLTGRYYAGQNFEKLIKERKDKKINFNWNMGNIIDDYFDNVSVRWIGKIKTPGNGNYIFVTRSDDGARLWIDDKLIIDDWTTHAVLDKRAIIYLEKGYHKIKVEYFDSGGHAAMKLLWLVPGWQRQKVVSPKYLKLSNN